MEQKTTNKLKELFPDSVVNKKIVLEKKITRLPRYISEYIIMKMVGENPTPENFAKVENFIYRYHPEKKEKDVVKSRIMEFGSTELLDQVKVTADPKSDAYWASIPTLDETKLPILRTIVINNKALLEKGTWGFITLENRGLGKNSMTITNFEPFQVTDYDIGYYQEAREQFSTNEWIDILINTIGFNPNIMSLEEKILHICRLIPLVERNTNFIELGPKGTGKTYLYRNISSYSRVISGGKVTPAVLFYNKGTRTPGLLGRFDTVVFDEVSSANLKDSEDTINKLKDFMESGVVSRGDHELTSGASLVFVGNIAISEQGTPVSPVQFEILPKEMRDTAFIDRFTGYIEGWKFQRIRESSIHLSQSYGFALDYFSEILNNLRKLDFSSIIINKIKLVNFDIRDEKAFSKNISGLLKIVFPDEKIEKEDMFLDSIIKTAVRLRQNVVTQKALMDTEFDQKELVIEYL